MGAGELRVEVAAGDDGPGVGVGCEQEADGEEGADGAAGQHQEGGGYGEQIYVEPRKKNEPWGEEKKRQARELFWQKFLEIAAVKADKWLEFLVGMYG